MVVRTLLHQYVAAIMLLAPGLAFGQSQRKEVSICKETALRLNAASDGAVRYQWYHDDVLVETATAGTLTVNEEGTYKALAVNAAGCVSDESVHIVVTFSKPQAVEDFVTVKMNTVTRIDVLANDQPVCSPISRTSLRLDQLPAHGEASVSDGSILFNPDKDYFGPDAFTYTVSDSNGIVSDQGSVSLDVVNVMPVVLAYFEASKSEWAASLHWGTSTEVNSAYFEIEKSVDASNWRAIGRVNARPEMQANRYAFTDSLPDAGTNYYRLKMADRDGTFAYSGIRSVYFPDFSWAELYPNPVIDLLSIMIRNPKVTAVRMINTAGITLLSRPVTSRKLLIDMKKYALGHYLFHFEQDNGAVKVFSIYHN